MEHQYIFEATLPPDTKTYVRRNADGELYQKLIEGKFCYVFNARKMGKSSLAVRVAQELTEKAGVNCVFIDFSLYDTKLEESDRWYANMLNTLTQELLLKVNLAGWLREREWLSPLGRFREFIELVMLPQLEGEKVAIFVDEIDSVLSLNFPTDDFFAFIRGCYNNRAKKPAYNNLTFCLLGVATPSDLIADKTRTPFNIGIAIELTGFTFAEAKGALTPGLAEKVDEPEATLQQILNWTGGQPFLTQKLCNLVVEKAEGSSADIPQLVDGYVINNWEGQDNPEHLRTIRDRVLRKEEKAGRLLGLYQGVLLRGDVAIDSSLEQMELRLSGLVVKRDEKLMVYNEIYRAVFDRDWVEKELEKLRPYSEAIALWEASGCEDESQLLRGQGLLDAQKWAAGKSLSDLDYRFLAACQKLQQREVEVALEVEKETGEILAKANQEANRKIQKANRMVGMGSAVLMVALLAATVAGIQLAGTKQELASIKAEIEKTSEQLTDSKVALIARDITVIIEGENRTLGSGTIVDRSEDGIYTVITAHHVVEDSGQYEVQTPDGKRHQINERQRLLGADLAVLKFNSKDKYNVAEYGNSQRVEPGATIYFAGYAVNIFKTPSVLYEVFQSTFLARPQTSKDGYELIFYGIASPGMSGGPILDARGRVIGIGGRKKQAEVDSYLVINYGIPIEKLETLQAKSFSTSTSPSEPSYPSTKFYCGDLSGVPATYVRGRRGPVPIIKWVDDSFPAPWTPQRRCEETSARFQRFYDDGQLDYLKADRINGSSVICVVETQPGACIPGSLLLHLKPETDPQLFLERLREFQLSGSGIPIDL